MVDGESDELLVQTQQELSEMTALQKVLRQDAEKARKAKLVEEIWEAHQRNDFSTMHRLRIQYQRNGRGPTNDTIRQLEPLAERGMASRTREET
eukprot:3099667-Pyramimonas_sp.AAC.1